MSHEFLMEEEIEVGDARNYIYILLQTSKSGNVRNLVIHNIICYIKLKSIMFFDRIRNAAFRGKDRVSTIRRGE